MAAYYNEIDPYAAAWLRNLIAAGHIAPGDVDERSIEDVHPDDLRSYTQCHFFAGIGVWSYALRLAGWPDDRPVWTGSCPCQPFSAAGKGAGFDDERHLWPAWHWLVGQCRPAKVFGEQVASKDAEPWLDLVFTDLEAMDYACGAVPFPAAAIGAPHIRDRLYWVADTDSGAGRKGSAHIRGWADGSHAQPRAGSGSGGLPDGLADTQHDGFYRPQGHEAVKIGDQPNQRLPDRDCAAGRLGHASGERCGEARGLGAGHPQRPADAGSAAGPGPTNGHWRDADWLLCRDGRWRPVEPGYEQMVDGSAGSLGRVRARDIEEIQEEVNAWAIRHQADAGEALRRVWLDLRAQTLCEREIGRFSGVQSPAVLLAFLRQLTEQGWRFAHVLAHEGAAAPQVIVRILRFDPGAARTPLRRELAEQLDGQPADPLQELSSILAHHTAKCWGEACRAKAGAASFPLAHNAPARVGRLRAYGNAIVAQAAATFIKASMTL